MVTSTSYVNSQLLLFNFNVSRFFRLLVLLLCCVLTFRRSANNQDLRIGDACNVLIFLVVHVNHSCNPASVKLLLLSDTIMLQHLYVT